MLRVLLTTCSLLVALNAHAQFFDGNRLVLDMREFEKVEESNTNADFEASGSYMGFILGVHDSISSKLCSSGKVTVRQVASIVTKYLKDNPGEWSAPAHKLVEKALRKAFPCR
jgi:hypothetical protein